MTATTDTPVTSDRLTADRDRLRWLARHWDALGVAVRLLVLYSTIREDLPDGPCCAKRTCGECLTCMWDGYRSDLEYLDGLNHEPWAEERAPEEGLTYDQALDDAEMRVAGHEDELLRGAA
jgi:hypothetical protein